MRHVLGALMVLAVSLASCGGDGDDSSEPGDAPLSGSSGPAAGTWFYGETALTENTCGSQAEEAARGGGDFEVLSVTSSSFIIDPKDGTDPFTCTLSGANFTCPRRAVGLVDGAGSTVTWQVAASGTFDGARRATGSQQGAVECEGSGCPLAEAALGASFPCRMVADFTIIAR